MTPQRLAILHVLCHAGTHLPPTEIYKQARQELPTLTEPTVYRTLEFLAENGLVHPSHSNNGRLTYQIAGDEIEVQHQVLETLYQKLESTSGYVRIDSHVTFFGVCPECQ
jgi:Fe2+ or Zn2+ uptake regulation protein